MTIYTIKNKVTGKQYVGQTTMSLLERWTAFLKVCCNPNKRKLQLHLDIYDLGVENFEVLTIDTATSPEELDRKEQQWIEKLQTLHPNGYNLTTGGKHYKHHEISKEKNRAAHLGKTASEMTRTKMSAMAKMQPKGQNSNRSKTFSVKYPNGEIHEYRGFNEFCKSHGLSTSQLRIQGKAKGFELV